MNHETSIEWGVLRRDGESVFWATMYKTEEDARNHATPLDSVEFREVGPWRTK